jgi:O-antigen/teichoic acid export membrane protein
VGLAPVIGVLTAVIFFLMLKEYARQVCFAGLRTTTVLILDSTVFLFQIGGLISLVFLGWLSSKNAYGIIGVVCALAGGAWLLSMRKQIAPKLGEALPHFRKNWAFSKWFFAYNLAFIAANQLYPWLLAAFYGTEANGVFGACMGVVFFANPFIIGLGNFLGPKSAHAYAHGGPAELRRVVSLANRFFLVTMTLFTVAMFLLGDWFLVLLYGRPYAGNGLVVTVLAVGQLVWALTVPSNFGLNAVERPDVSFKSLLLSLAVMLSLGLWAVYAWGPIGVAIGLLAGNLAALVYTRVAYARQIRVLEAQRATL